MENDEWKVPTEYHTIQLGPVYIFISAEVRKEIESWLKGLEPVDNNSMIHCESVLGEDLTITAGAIQGLWDSTPELRRRARLFDETQAREKRDQGFLSGE